MPTLTILGSGEAFDPLLPNSSLLYEGERTVLIDCGFAAVQALWRRSLDPDLLDAVLLTHHHADHTFGVPALLMVMETPKAASPRKRTRPLTLIGPPGTQRYITALFDLAYTPGMKRLSFPVEFMECAPGEAATFGPITIKTALPDHGIPVLSTRWEESGVPRFAYSADGKVTPATRQLFRGAPTLAHECYALPGGEGPVHTHVEDVLKVAAESGAETLILVHQSADQRHPIADYARTQKIFGGRVLMPEGMTRISL
ncbi:MAG: ribonuclease Z [Chloroflexi bacterium]|nr:ribonuclease Z [Chloroflexota bacterium]